MTNISDELVISPDRKGLRDMLLVELMLCAFSLIVALFVPAVGCILLFLFGFAAGVVGFEYIFPSYIKLSPEGFSARFNFFYRRYARWSDVEQFAVVFPNPRICFSFRPTSGRYCGLRFGWHPYDEFMACPSGQDIEKVVALLNEYRARYGIVVDSSYR